MKSRRIPLVLSFISALFVPALLHAQGASTGVVVWEEPDGAVIVRNSATMNLEAGYLLAEGDTVKSNEATVLISVCDGSLITLYPKTEVVVAMLSAEEVRLHLVKGELLGDSTLGCPIGVDNLVGTARISKGVYGVLLNETGEGWTLQVRNLDGTVTFTGDPKLDTSALTVSLVEPGKAISIPAGEEIIVRGIYDASTDIFSLLAGGAAMAMMSNETIDQLRNDAATMSARATGRPEDLPAREKAIPKLEETPGGEKAIPVIIEIPWRDIETASDKG